MEKLPYTLHDEYFKSHKRKDQLSPKNMELFQGIIYSYYKDHKRVLPWRDCENPYHVIVSEIMLQQTQVDRVKGKYERFIEAFPTLESLAYASTPEVIMLWNGLGYNRRALSLHQFALRVLSDFEGDIPQDPEILTTFKGIGPATASSIVAFAFNKPTVFIETNIRTVFIHCFFAHEAKVRDDEIAPLVAQTLDKENPRAWYYALMDYGVMLKKKYINPSRKSAHYTRQSKFEGSDRQVRGLILKLLVEAPLISQEQFIETIPREPEKVKRILSTLEKEGFIKSRQGQYTLL